MMDAERWQQVQELFAEAVALPTGEREAWITDRCGDDTTLRDELMALVWADVEAGESIAEAVRGGEDLLLEGKSKGPDSEALTALSPGGGHLVGVPTDSEGRVRFGRYTVDARVGQGGFGVVYRGQDPLLKRRVAIKTCNSVDESLRRRFFREGQIAAGLQHPNIVTVHELGVEAGVPYMVQEFLDGDDLRQLVPSHRQLTLERRLQILLDAARGLEHAHRAGVLHRDVKPANIRVLGDGSVKILDFGIAKLLDAESQLTGTGTTLGTVGYLAPEQLRSEPIDARADIFAFGVVAYELLTGERPFQGQDFSQVSYQLLFVEPEPVSRHWPGCPKALVELVDRCLAKERDDRPADFGEIVHGLEGLLEQERSGATLMVADPVIPKAAASPVVPERPTEPLSPPPPPRRRWVPVAAGLATLTLAAVLGMGWLGGRGTPEEVAALAVGGGMNGESAAGAAGPRGETSRLGGSSAGADLPTSSDEGVSTAPDPEPDSEAADGFSGDSGGPTRQPTTDGADGQAALPEANPEANLPEATNPEPPTAVADGSTESLSAPPDSTTPDPIQAFDSASDPPGDPAAVQVADPGGAGAGGEPGATDGLPDGVTSDRVPASELATNREVEAVVASLDGLPATDPPPPVSDPTATGPEAGAGTTPDGMTPAETVPPVVEEPVTPPPPAGAAQISRGDFLVEGPGVVAPRLLGEFEPDYPRRARRLGREGRVVVKVLVDEQGRALQAIAPNDEHGFGEAARQAALSARFSPATLDGVAGKMWMNLPFEFRISD